MSITVESLRNPARKSGFDHVGYRVHRGRPQSKPYQAQAYGGGAGPSGTGAPLFMGLRRDTSEEAAQDYCDYINGQPKRIEVKQRPGRPDLYVRADGTFFSDIPGEGGRVRESLRRNPERKLQLKTEATVAAELLELQHVDWVAEYKARGDQYSCNVVLGQLLRRHLVACREGTPLRLAAVFGTEPSEESRALLNRYAITVLVRA